MAKLYHTWSQYQVYEPLQYVEYPQGYVYLCIQTANLGESPVSAPLKWKLCFASGFPGTVTSIASALPILAVPNPITTTGTITTSMATNKLIGRYTAGTGVMQEITIGSGLTLSAGGTLSASLGSIAWLLDGNTVGSEKWIGTADNFAFPVRVNNTEIWSWDDSTGAVSRGGSVYSHNINYNTTWGVTAGGSVVPSSGRRTAFGYQAGTSLPSTGANDVTYFGYRAGASNTGAASYNNSAFGNYALEDNVTGQRVCAFGNYALTNATATLNTAFGINSGFTLVTGGENAFFGGESAYSLEGERNTLIGVKSGNNASMTSGDDNVIVGAYAGVNTGSKNVILGAYAGASSTISNMIAIGYAAVPTSDNQLTIGSTTSYINQWRNFYSASGITEFYFRTSTPESAQAATRGSIAFVDDATDGETYIKTTGTGNTGWGQVLAATAVTTEAVTSDTTLTIKYNGTTYKLLAKA